MTKKRSVFIRISIPFKLKYTTIYPRKHRDELVASSITMYNIISEYCLISTYNRWTWDILIPSIHHPTFFALAFTRYLNKFLMLHHDNTAKLGRASLSSVNSDLHIVNQKLLSR
jgi:hypothetical protein